MTVLAWLRRVFTPPSRPPTRWEPIYSCPKCGFAIWPYPVATKRPTMRYCGPDQKAPNCDEEGEHFDFYNTCLRCGFVDQWRRPMFACADGRP